LSCFDELQNHKEVKRMKTPSGLAPWTGDLGMKLHAHKPGASEGVTLEQHLELTALMDH
jgi:hypothetical protein